MLQPENYQEDMLQLKKYQDIMLQLKNYQDNHFPPLKKSFRYAPDYQESVPQ